MERKLLRELLAKLEIELAKSEKRATETQQAALEISRSAAASPSQSGDREHAVNQASIVSDAHTKLKKITQEVREEILKPKPQITRAYTFISFELEGSSDMQIFLTDTPVSLPGITMVSTASPLGRALQKRTIGERFLVEISGSIKSGEILSIE